MFFQISLGQEDFHQRLYVVAVYALTYPVNDIEILTLSSVEPLGVDSDTRLGAL